MSVINTNQEFRVGRVRPVYCNMGLTEGGGGVGMGNVSNHWCKRLPGTRVGVVFGFVGFFVN